jgi:hypothetical protein
MHGRTAAGSTVAGMWLGRRREPTPPRRLGGVPLRRCWTDHPRDGNASAPQDNLTPAAVRVIAGLTIEHPTMRAR